MSSILSIVITCFLIFENQSVVKEFHELASKKEEAVFIKKFKQKSDPTIQAYVCAVEMKQAEYHFNPIVKLKIFNSTKNKLELLITKHPNNTDLRYIRLMLQERIPRFLGYRTSIEKDKSFLFSKIKAKQISKEFKYYIYKNTSL